MLPSFLDHPAYIKADESQLLLGVPEHPPFHDAERRFLEEGEEVGGARGRMLGKYCMGYRPVEVAILYSVTSQGHCRCVFLPV